MKTHELRIGNYVLDNLGGILKIKGINEESDLSHVRGILLTEEWFLKSGFEIKPTRSFHKTPIYFRSDMDSDYCFSYADFRDDYGFYIEYTDSPFKSDDYKLYPISFGIKYVHQLQNLYFSVVGAELEFEENKGDDEKPY
jgi:hypothetical protein